MIRKGILYLLGGNMVWFAIVGGWAVAVGRVGAESLITIWGIPIAFFGLWLRPQLAVRGIAVAFVLGAGGFLLNGQPAATVFFLLLAAIIVGWVKKREIANRLGRLTAKATQ
jgi:hypothetical protein